MAIGEALYEWLGPTLSDSQSVGVVLPCPTAFEIKSLRFDNVRQQSLSWIWAESSHLIAFAELPGCRTLPQL
jgi:MoaA/NifB/PqqE/SkfB family radical SAM enzyme